FSGDLQKNPEKVLSYYVLPASCVSFRRRILDSLLPIPENIKMLADAYLVILVPLLSPVVAIPDPLTKYRIHGANSYYAEEGQETSTTENERRKLALILIEAMLKWVAGYKEGKESRHFQLFCRRWAFESQGLSHKMNPPGRWQTFLFLLRRNYVYT